MIENGFLKEAVYKEIVILHGVKVEVAWENFSSLYVDVDYNDDDLANDDIPMMLKSETEDTSLNDIVNKIYDLDLSLTDKVNLNLLFAELNGINDTLRVINDSLFPLSNILDIIITGINKRKEVKYNG